jgi:NitT/TauT family transport system ATP-binding protein
MAIIKFSNVYKSFFHPLSNERLLVLRDLSLEVKHAQCVALIGPSGCGKTTLLNLAAGFTYPDQGQVLSNNEPVHRPDRKRTMVFQDPALFPWKTIFENVAFGLRCQGCDQYTVRQKVQELLHVMRLSQFAPFYPRQLSGGMKQKVALARALAVEPQIILMDEPFSALEQQTRHALQEELSMWQQRLKKSVVFVTHCIEEAIFLADTVIVLTPRPASVQAVVEIGFPKPRLADIRSAQEFFELRNRLASMMTGSRTITEWANGTPDIPCPERARSAQLLTG